MTRSEIAQAMSTLEAVAKDMDMTESIAVALGAPFNEALRKQIHTLEEAIEILDNYEL